MPLIDRTEGGRGHPGRGAPRPAVCLEGLPGQRGRPAQHRAGAAQRPSSAPRPWHAWPRGPLPPPGPTRPRPSLVLGGGRGGGSSMVLGVSWRRLRCWGGGAAPVLLGPVTADSAWASSAPSAQPDRRLHEVTDLTCPVLVPAPPCHRQHPPEAGASSQLHKSSPNTIDV